MIYHIWLILANYYIFKLIFNFYIYDTRLLWNATHHRHLGICYVLSMHASHHHYNGSMRSIPPTNNDVIKWKHFPRYAKNSPHKGQWRGALMFSLICAWANGWVSNREAGDLRQHRAPYDVTVVSIIFIYIISYTELYKLNFELNINIIIAIIWSFQIIVSNPLGREVQILCFYSPNNWNIYENRLASFMRTLKNNLA